jgi:hypothetical protein
VESFLIKILYSVEELSVSITLFLFLFILKISLCSKMLCSSCTDPGAKQTHQSQGHEEEIAGVNTYKTGQGKSVIVLFTDIFGYSFVNTRKVADRFAQETGTTVLIPDCFHGDPVNLDVPNFRDTLPDWKQRHPATEVCAMADKFISTIKGHYQSIQVTFKLFFNNMITVFILFSRR